VTAQTRVKRVALLRAGGTPTVDAPEMWSDEGTPWVSISDMTASPVVRATARHVTSLGIATKRLPVGDPGTTLFAMYASVGAIGVLGVCATWNQAILGITADRLRASDRFLRYWLEHLSRDLDALTRSNTQDNLNAEQVGNLPFPLVDVQEQRAIADFLDTETARIDALLAKKQRMIELLRERLGLAPEASLAGLRNEPELVALKYLVRESDKRRGDDSARELLSVSIHSGVVPRAEASDKESRADDFSNYKTCERGDIVLNRMRAFQGAVGVVNSPGIVSPDYTVLNLGPRLFSDYVHYLMRSHWFVGEMAARIRGIGAVDQGQVRTPRVNFADLREIAVPVPPLEEQMRLVVDWRNQAGGVRSVIARLELEIPRVAA
jgi:type I restriction enzyme S subunit